MSDSGRHREAEDGGPCMEQPQIDPGALVQLCKMPGSGFRVPVGFPAAAAGKIAAPVLDEADHIGQRVAQKDTDLMGNSCRSRLPQSAASSGRQ